MEDELLEIGRHMRQQPDFPVQLSELYSDDAIRQSFNKYGGIIRHVLPHSVTTSKLLKAEKSRAIGSIDWRNYFANPDIESPHISHFIAKYMVNPPYFDEISYTLVNADLERLAEDYINKLTLQDQIFILRNYGSNNIVQVSTSPTYEYIVAHLLVDGVPLMRRSMKQSADGYTETLFAPKLAPKVETKSVPFFADMKMRTLYKPPPGRNFPFVDLYYIDKIVEEEPEDALITLTRKEGGAGAVKVLSVPNVQFKKLHLPDLLLVDFLFCPHPSVGSVANNATTSLAADTMAVLPAGTVIDVSILQVPESLLELSVRKRGKASSSSSRAAASNEEGVDEGTAGIVSTVR
eukprot:gene26202-34823_t